MCFLVIRIFHKCFETASVTLSAPGSSRLRAGLLKEWMDSTSITARKQLLERLQEDVMHAQATKLQPLLLSLHSALRAERPARGLRDKAQVEGSSR